MSSPSPPPLPLHAMTETRPVSETSFFYPLKQNTGGWKKSKNQVNLYAIHHRQNPLICTKDGITGMCMSHIAFCYNKSLTFTISLRTSVPTCVLISSGKELLSLQSDACNLQHTCVNIRMIKSRRMR
jgi:hypothetical protein